MGASVSPVTAEGFLESLAPHSAPREAAEAAANKSGGGERDRQFNGGESLCHFSGGKGRSTV